MQCIGVVVNILDGPSGDLDDGVARVHTALPGGAALGDAADRNPFDLARRRGESRRRWSCPCRWRPG
jgi:hypothetical protein